MAPCSQGRRVLIAPQWQGRSPSTEVPATQARTHLPTVTRASHNQRESSIELCHAITAMHALPRCTKWTLSRNLPSSLDSFSIVAFFVADPCQWANDGQCDVPETCEEGDYADCSAPATAPSPPLAGRRLWIVGSV